MTPEQKKYEAERLTKDETLQAALEIMRAEALEALAKVEPTNADEIRKAQANYAAVDRFSEALQTIIVQNVPKPEGVVA